MPKQTVVLAYNSKREQLHDTTNTNFYAREAIRLEMLKRDVEVLEVFVHEPSDLKVLYKYLTCDDVSLIYCVNFSWTKMYATVGGPNILFDFRAKIVCASDSMAGNVDKIYDGNSEVEPSHEHRIDSLFHADAGDIPLGRHLFPEPTKHYHYRSMCLPTNFATGEPFVEGDSNFKDRDIDVLFAFNLRGWFDKRTYESLTDNAKAVVEHMVCVLAVKETRASIQDAIWEELERLKVRPFEKYSYAHLVVARLVNRAVRDFRRQSVLAALSNINVYLITPHPDRLQFDIPSNWTVIAGVSRMELQSLYRRTKIALNVMPAYAYGAHERVLTSMAAGAVSLTDRNLLMSSKFTDNEDILFYDYDHRAIEDVVASLLANPRRLEGIASCGQRKALAEFSPGRLVEDILAAANGALTQADVPFSS